MATTIVRKQEEIQTQTTAPSMRMMNMRSGGDLSNIRDQRILVSSEGTVNIEKPLTFMQGDQGLNIYVEFQRNTSYDLSLYDGYLYTENSSEPLIASYADDMFNFNVTEEWTKYSGNYKCVFVVKEKDKNIGIDNYETEQEIFVSDEFNITIQPTFWVEGEALLLPAESRDEAAVLFSKGKITINQSEGVFSSSLYKLGNEGDRFITLFDLSGWAIDESKQYILFSNDNQTVYKYEFIGNLCAVPERVTSTPGNWQYCFAWEKDGLRIISNKLDGQVVENFLVGTTDEPLVDEGGIPLKDVDDNQLASADASRGVYRLKYTGEWIDQALDNLNNDIYITKSGFNLENGEGNNAIQSLPDKNAASRPVYENNNNNLVFDFNQDLNTNALEEFTKKGLTMPIPTPYGARGDFSQVIGGKGFAYGRKSIAEGTSTIAYGDYAHAEGNTTVALGGSSHSEGIATVASGDGSHAEGNKTIARGDYSTAIGNQSTTDKNATGAFASGGVTKAKGQYSSAFGFYGVATGENSFVANQNTKANSKNSAAFGLSTTADTTEQFTVGRYNAVNNNALFIVGNGTGASSSNRKNVLEVLKDGRVTIGAGPTNPMDVATKKYVDDKTIDPYEDISESVANILLDLVNSKDFENVTKGEACESIEFTDADANYLLEKARNNIALRLASADHSVYFLKPHIIKDEKIYYYDVTPTNEIAIKNFSIIWSFNLSTKKFVIKGTTNLLDTEYIRITGLGDLVDGKKTSITLENGIWSKINAYLADWGKRYYLRFTYGGLYSAEAELVGFDSFDLAIFKATLRDGREVLFNVTSSEITMKEVQAQQGAIRQLNSPTDLDSYQTPGIYYFQYNGKMMSYSYTQYIELIVQEEPYSNGVESMGIDLKQYYRCGRINKDRTYNWETKVWSEWEEF